VLALVVAAALVGCKRPDDHPRPLDADRLHTSKEPSACPSYARAWCERVRVCEPKFFDAEYGDDARCDAAIAPWCVLELSAADGGEDADSIAACVAALPAMSCDDWTRRNLPAACDRPGARRLDEPCAVDAQCASSYCAGTAGWLACGRCAELPREGEPCERGRCPNGLSCFTDDRCRSPSGVNGACNTDRDCGYHLSCDGRRCRVPAGVGESCDETWTVGVGCDARAGLRCLAGRCAQRPRVAVGGACASSTLCLGGECDAATRRCVASGVMGEACDPTRFRPCEPPFACLGGVCGLPDPTRCAR
jgi:hypothetical protein